MNLVESGFWGPQVHRRGAGRGFSITFPSAKVLKSGKAVFLQIRLKLDLFWKYELRFLLAIQGFEAPQSPFYTSIDTV